MTPRRRKDDGWRGIIRDALTALAVLFGALALYFASGRVANTERIAKRTADKVRRLDLRDRDSLRRAAYRLCARGRADRAEVQWRAIRARRFRELRRLQDPHGRPILDCEPNLEGHGAAYLPADQQTAFARAWAAGAISLPELGVCPKSMLTKRPNETVEGC